MTFHEMVISDTEIVSRGSKQ